jgi:hypothetical protein
MDSNIHSTRHSTGTPAGLAGLVAELQGLVDQDLGGLADAVLAERVMALRGLMDRLEGHWLQELADLDARGAAGAEHGVQAGSTAAWLRCRLRMGAGTAAGLVRTARALYHGPLTGTAQAVADGELSPAHAQVLAAGTQDLPDHLAADAEPVLVEAARRLDPPRLRRVVAHLRLVADPDGADDQAEQRQQRRGLWLASTWEGMVAVNGLLDPEAGQTVLAALEPWPVRPAPTTPERVPASGGCPGGTGPPQSPERAPPADRRGPTPAAGDRRPGQPAWPWWAGGGRSVGWGRWRRRRVGGWLVTARSPGCWSPATPATTTRAAMTASRGGCGRRRGCSPRPLGVPRPSRWRSAGPAGSSRPPNGPPWWSATAAAPSPAATGPWPGVRPIICATGCTAAPPTWPTWPWCAGLIIGRCMRAAGGWSATRMVA